MKCASVLALLLAVFAIVEAAPLLHSDSSTAIPGKYIVVLHENMTIADRDEHIANLKNKMTALGADAEVEFVYNALDFMGFSARLDENALKEVITHPDVKYVEVDQTVQVSYIQEPQSPEAVVIEEGATWGIDRIDQRALPLDTRFHYNSIGGQGVDVYVIDTGIYASHSEFGGRAKMVYNAITNEASDDLNGHGTHCSGTIGGTKYGVAKHVNLFGVKVLSAQGSGTNAGVIAGVNYVTNNKVATRKSIGSMSLGGGVSTALDDAVAASIRSGVPYAIAAGNSNADACNSSPARTPAAITVGATQNNDARASYSNYGRCLDIFAPGTSITSAWIGGVNAVNTISGTSMATPHVAGTLALQQSVTSTYTDANLVADATSGVVTSPGTNSPNVFLYSKY